MRRALALTTAALLLTAGCGEPRDTGATGSGSGLATGSGSGLATGAGSGAATGAGSGPTTGSGVSSGASSTGGATSGPASTGHPPKFDVSGPADATTGGPPVDMCKVADDMNGVGECGDQAPPGSFDPDIQWTWTGASDPYSIVTPLVANLTDDDDNGVIDLCDQPDVVVVASTLSGAPNGGGRIYVLDGATGTVHVKIDSTVDHTVTPAVGDIDDDGLPEIVTGQVGGKLMGFEHDGTPKWVSNQNLWSSTGFDGVAIYSSAVALADMDNDGDVEIVSANWVADHLGNPVFTAPQPSGNWSATAIADLDGDGDQELVLGHAAYHHDGSPYVVTGLGSGYPQVANLDGDPEPEILLMNKNGITVLEHDGAVKYQGLRPTGDPVGFTTWLRPATVHDFDGDGTSEYAVSSANNYTVYEPDATIVWKAAVSDQSGIAAGTAFDFLGDGVAEAMYADEQFMFIFDGTGSPLLQIARTSGTLSEYPVVADVDDDGSAEVVVVSNQFNGASPTVQVIRDVQDRWIQARRIWNQHTYHVTNVREDGTIPQFEPPSWAQLNTYRTNAQIEGGGLCKPPPAG